MKRFLEMIHVKPKDRVLDLGGHPDIWSYVDIPLDITILNVSGAISEKKVDPHEITYVVGDACNIDQFSAGDFDIVYSNSVIEHVGPDHKQREFAAQVRKFSTKYWIQTPSKWFPIEAHCGMPFWWFYPEAWRQQMIRRWRRKLPGWTAMVETTRCLEKKDLREMFPGSRLYVERIWGIPKSYVIWSDSGSDLI